MIVLSHSMITANAHTPLIMRAGLELSWAPTQCDQTQNHLIKIAGTSRNLLSIYRASRHGFDKSRGSDSAAINGIGQFTWKYKRALRWMKGEAGDHGNSERDVGNMSGYIQQHKIRQRP